MTEPVSDEAGERHAAPARRTIAVVIALALIVPASILAVTQGQRPTAGGGGVLPVVTGQSAHDAPGGTTVTGRLAAAVVGSRACFWVSDSFETGTARSLLEFPPGFAATRDLDLLDGSGSVVASSGDIVTFTTPSRPLSGLLGSIQGCAVGGDEVPIIGIHRALSQSASAAGLAKASNAVRATAKRESTDGRYDISSVVSTAAAAETQLFGSASHSSESDLEDIPVVAFVAKGSFSGIDEKLPPGAEPVGGPYLVWVAALSDGLTTDWGILDKDPHLEKLGPVSSVPAANSTASDDR